MRPLEHVEPGGERLLKWARGKLASLTRFRLDARLPALSKHYVVDGSTVNLRSTDWGDLIRITGGGAWRFVINESDIILSPPGVIPVSMGLYDVGKVSPVSTFQGAEFPILRASYKTSWAAKNNQGLGWIKVDPTGRRKPLSVVQSLAVFNSSRNLFEAGTGVLGAAVFSGSPVTAGVLLDGIREASIPSSMFQLSGHYLKVTGEDKVYYVSPRPGAQLEVPEIFGLDEGIVFQRSDATEFAEGLHLPDSLTPSVCVNMHDLFYVTLEAPAADNSLTTRFYTARHGLLHTHTDVLDPFSPHSSFFHPKATEDAFYVAEEFSDPDSDEFGQQLLTLRLHKFQRVVNQLTGNTTYQHLVAAEVSFLAEGENNAIAVIEVSRDHAYIYAVYSAVIDGVFFLHGRILGSDGTSYIAWQEDPSVVGSQFGRPLASVSLMSKVVFVTQGDIATQSISFVLTDGTIVSPGVLQSDTVAQVVGGSRNHAYSMVDIVTQGDFRLLGTDGTNFNPRNLFPRPIGVGVAPVLLQDPDRIYLICSDVTGETLETSDFTVAHVDNDQTMFVYKEFTPLVLDAFAPAVPVRSSIIRMQELADWVAE